MGRELEIVEGRNMTAADVRSQVNLIQGVMKSVMKEGTHYGVIPGCDKPALYKPGAEVLAVTFRLAFEFEELPGSVESDSFICYKINCNLRHIPSGANFGNGRGTCNSKEKKYRTRSVSANKATEGEKAVGRKETRTGRNGSFDVYIIPQDPWDLQNTIYKMACKRASTAAILNATAASDIFAQDIEDLPEGTILDEGKPASRKPQTEKPKKAAGDDETRKKAMVEVFDAQRQRIGDKRYYEILGNEGFEKAEQLSLKDGERIIMVLKSIKVGEGQ
jgi:hypothetical protein